MQYAVLGSKSVPRLGGPMSVLEMNEWQAIPNVPMTIEAVRITAATAKSDGECAAKCLMS